MEVFNRTFNAPLNIKHKLDDGAGGKFVRAFLTDKTGAALTPAYTNLAHIGSGVYAENALTMPNLDQIVVSYAVFTDNTYTTKDVLYSEDCDIFEKQLIDLTNLLPSGQAINVTFANQKIGASVNGNKVVASIVDKPSPIKVEVSKSEVQVEFKINNEIEGVIND